MNGGPYLIQQEKKEAGFLNPASKAFKLIFKLLMPMVL